MIFIKTKFLKNNFSILTGVIMQRDNLLTFQEHSKNNILSLKENLVNMFIGVNLIILHFLGRV